ncbi:MAG: Hpt domain-containing protein [Methylophaga sp.]|nr:Hpt domain-containing protein [Methylophaga sp.]
MARTSSGNYNALAWVQDEVQQSLADALQALTTFIDAPDNDSAIEQCITHIYQVSGTMEMLNLDGAQMLAEEMLSSAILVRDEKNKDHTKIQDSILKGLLILPNYLRLLSDELEDHPLHLIAILNELRNSRGDDEFETGDLFSPNLAVALPDHIVPDPNKSLPKLSIPITKLTHAFQYSLLRWFKEDDDLSLKRIGNIARYLRLSCIQERSITLWWAAEGVVESLLDKGLPATPQIKLMVGKLNTAIKLFTIEGEQEFIALFPSDLTQDFLLQIARARSSGKHILTLKEAFNLQLFDPEQSQRIYNLTDSALPDVHSELVNQTQEIKEEINRFHEQSQTAESITTIVDQLNNMAGTFELLTDHSTSELLHNQARQLDELISQQQLPDDDHLMSLADILLKVEYQLQSGTKIEDQQTIEANQLQQTVLKECLTELILIKESFAALADEAEDISKPVAEISSQLDLIAGSLTLLNLNDAAVLLENTAKQLSQMVVDNKQLSSENLGLFAEIIASADLYMEGIQQGGSQQAELLERAQNILDQFNSVATATIPSEPDFGELDTPDFPLEIEETGVARYIKTLLEEEMLPTTPDEESGVSRYIKLLEQESVSVETGVARYLREQENLSEIAIEEESSADNNEIDVELAEVFVEEAEDILAQLTSTIPRWKIEQDNESLADIRRHFHTLKGSGRMAGANVIGELSWATEHLLNQVLEGLRPLSPQIVELVDNSFQLMPDLVSRYSAREMESTDASNHIIERANYLLTEKTEEELSEEDELQQIFFSEATQHIATFNHAFQDIELPFDLHKDLLRAAHSLKGCANIAQITSVATVATKLDHTLRTLHEQNLSLDEQQFSLLSSVINGLDRTIATLDEAQPQDVPNEATLLEHLEQMLAATNSDSGGNETEKQIDPEFLAVYLEETDELLNAYSDQLQQLQQEPDNTDYQNAIHQTLDSLTENAQHAELNNLTVIYQLLNKLTSKVSDSNDTVSTLLELGYEEVSNQIEGLMQGQPANSIDTYIQEVEAVLSLEPEPEPEPEPIQDDSPPQESEAEIELFTIPTEEPELLEAFTEECAELLESSGNAIKIWQQDENDQEAVMQLQRDLHTLKGGSRLTGIIPIADLTHQTESLTFLAIDNKCETDDRFFNLLLRCQDRLAEMQEQLENRTEFAFAHDLVTEIAQFSNQPVPIQTRQVKPSNQILDQQLANKSETHVQHEQIRVRADLLDFISNFAGEVNISRDRVSQQNTAIQLQLTEMDSTVDRLQEQLRKLEIETETQILFRYEDEQSKQDSEFDPLELDRFSMIQQLSRSLTESVSDIHEITQSLDTLVRDSDAILLQQSRLSTDLQQGLMNTRLLPFDGLIPRFERIIRQVNAELGKKSQLLVHGANYELDRTILDRVVAPIEHIIRNAVAHGIELPKERVRSGKDETGQITISILREGSEVLITLMDDGLGIDVEKVRKKALEQGLINPDHMPSDEDLIQLILTSGFSTSDDVSQISGRGVGMDVVSSEIRALKGRLSIQSTAGHGTTFNIRLPLTLSIMQSLLVGCGDQEYAIPLVAVHAGDRISVQAIEALLESEEKPQYEFNGEYYEFISLASLLKQPLVLPDDPKLQLPVLLFRYGDMHIALLVDVINSNREIVLKPVGEQLAHIDAITGATILGDGEVVFILDIPTLVDTFNEKDSVKEDSEVELLVIESGQPENREDRTLIALVVDDSITMRKASGNLLKRHGFDVITARDGIDAVAQLNEQVPDIILLDIEMPRMDGFEFATLVRNIDQYKSLPIIMITSRTGDKHRERAMGIGVNAYLGKPYQEIELMETIQALLEQ